MRSCEFCGGRTTLALHQVGHVCPCGSTCEPSRPSFDEVRFADVETDRFLFIYLTTGTPESRQAYHAAYDRWWAKQSQSGFESAKSSERSMHDAS